MVSTTMVSTAVAFVAVALLLSPFSVSHGVATQALFWKQPQCSNIQPPPRCVHPGGGVTGQSRVKATQARMSEPLGSGALERQHPATPASFPPPGSPMPSALQLIGVWVCLCVRRSVRVSCGLGGHVRDRHRCHKGEYALVSSRFTKTAHPACPPLAQQLWTAQTVQSPNSAP